MAARGGDDIWVEMRRQPNLSAEATAAIAELRDEPPVSPVEESVAQDDVTPVLAADVSLAEEPADDVEMPELLGAAESDIPADEAEVEVEVRVPILTETHRLDEHSPVEEVTLLSEVEEVGAPADEPEPLPVALIAIHDMAPEEPPVRHDHPGSDADEPISFDIDSDRDLAEELLTLDADFEGSMLANAQGWNDDVMTEGDLGELLRATAAAVIAGEINHDDEAPLAAVAAADAALAAQFEGGHDDVAPGITIVDSASAEPVAVSGSEEVRATEELPAEPAFAARSISEAELLDAEEAGAAPESPAFVVFTMEHETMSVDEDGGQPAAPAAVGAGDNADGYPREVVAEVETAGEDNEDVTPSRPAAVILPLTRPTKVDSAGESRASVATTLQRLLRLAAARGAGTVYVVGHSAPLIRVDGEFSSLEGEPALSGAFVERLLAEVAPSTRGASPSAEWLIDVPEIGRVRCVTFRDHRGPGVIFRLVPARAIAADQLALSAEVQALCSEADGLILVTGLRGSGKSTLLTSFIDLINRTRSDHVITTEAQIDFVHEPKRSFISQREVRGEEAMVTAVRAASREEPDVLLIEDVRTQELATLAIDAAEAGRLVFASVPGHSTASAIERLIELFPAERREKVQASLAAGLRGVVSQVLLRKLRGGRVAAREVLLNTPAVSALIAEGRIFQLPAALESGRGAGMISLAESLASLVQEGTVHPAHAYRKAPNRDQFLAALRRNGVDAAIAERLG